MHFHTPSEHLIDGITYPMELHIVSINNENPEVPHYLVFSVLFKMGKENPFIHNFLNLVPNEKTTQQIEKHNNIKLSDILSATDLKKYYHYKGSLTTPPYTETVNWVVLKKVFDASPESIKAINKIEGNHARHIEPENNRPVESD
ncbi:MAG: carbonic anhydrase family protein [Methylococcales bacterium]|nr:carbonic anhydrase family protein [Methylococcales bacterium]